MEHLVLKEFLDPLDQLDHLDNLALQVVLDHVEILVWQEILVKKGQLVLRVQKVKQDFLGMQDHQETKDQRDQLVQLDNQALKELLEVLVYLVHKDPRELLGHQETQEHLEILVHKVLKGHKEPLDLQDHWDHKEVKVHRVLRVILVLQVHPALLEIPDQGVILGHPEHLEIKVRREILVLQDQQGNGDNLVHLVLQGLLVMWEPRDHLDLLVRQDNQEMQGLQDEMVLLAHLVHLVK